MATTNITKEVYCSRYISNIYRLDFIDGVILYLSVRLSVYCNFKLLYVEKFRYRAHSAMLCRSEYLASSDDDDDAVMKRSGCCCHHELDDAG